MGWKVTAFIYLLVNTSSKKESLCRSLRGWMSIVCTFCALLMAIKFVMALLRGGWVKWFNVNTRRVWDLAWSCSLVDRWRALITGDEGIQRLGETAI